MAGWLVVGGDVGDQNDLVGNAGGETSGDHAAPEDSQRAKDVIQRAGQRGMDFAGGNIVGARQLGVPGSQVGVLQVR
jgi:hypothetical protein